MVNEATKSPPGIPSPLGRPPAGSYSPSIDEPWTSSTCSETAVAFFVSLVSSILGKSVQDQTVILGEMSVQGMLLKVASLPERMQLAVEAGAKRILIPSENKRDVADVPDAILTAIQWQFYDSPTKAAIMALGMG